MRRASRGRSSRRWSDSISLASIFSFPALASSSRPDLRATAPARSPTFSRPSSPSGGAAGVSRRAPIRTCKAIARAASCRKTLLTIARPDPASGAKATRLLPIGTRRDTCRSIRTRRAGSPRAPLRAATSTISPSGAPRACSEGSSQPTGTRPATSPPTPRPASKLRSALFAPAISTTLPSARPAAWRAAFPPPTRRNGCGCAGRSWTGRCSRSTTCSPWSSPARP